MRHYVLTRAYRSPDYPLEANRRRVELLRRVTAASLREQGGDWEWIVYIDPRDPLLEDRLDAFASAGVPVIPIAVGRDATEVIDWSGAVLTTRIDDDDAFAVGAFNRLRAAVKPSARRGYVFPMGHRVCAGQVMPIRHGRNAWSSLYAPHGDRIHVRAVQHLHLRNIAPITYIDERPSWLWVRHQDAETGFQRADQPITADVKQRYAVDWEFMEGLR